MATKRRRKDRLSHYEAPTYLELRHRVAENARRVRDAKGWTQEQAAELLDMSVPVLQAVEAGRSNLTLVTIARLCDGLEIEAAELFRSVSEKLPKRKVGRPKKAP